MSRPPSTPAEGIPDALVALRTGLAAPEARAGLDGRRPTGGTRQAAVLALFWRDLGAAEAEADSGDLAGLRLVAIEKAAHLRRHAGQVAFPGGRIEPGDPSVTAAALREAEEEVGIVPGSVEVLGRLPSASVAASGFDVATVVGWWREPVPLAPVDVGEVAAVHQLSVPHLTDPGNRATWIHPSGMTGPVFLVDDLFVWGLTAHFIAALFDLAGWTRTWDETRRLEIPERFFRGRH